MTSPLQTTHLFSGESTFYNNVIGQSLRLNVGSDYKLDRQMVTPASVTGTICTASWWMKKSAGGTVQSFINCRDNQASGEYAAYWTYGAAGGSLEGTDSHSFRSGGSEGTVMVGAAAAVTPYRDSNAWYHTVIRYDSTQGTAANRIRIYINGELQTLTNTTYPAQNAVNQFWNNDGEHLILFGNGEDSGDSFDGYIAEFNWVDGLSLAPESFGESKNGVWIPKAYSGAYGANGSRYTFSDSSDIGADTSGNGNDLDRVSNLAATDVVPDSPENNFSTLIGNQLAESTDYQAYIKGAYSEGNLKVKGSSGDWNNGKSSQLVNSGKWYAEFRVGEWNGSNYVRIGAYARPARTYDEYFWLGNGTAQIDGTARNDRVGSFAVGDVIQIAIDLENNNIFFGKNNTWQNSATEGEIEAGTSTNAFASGSEVPTGDGHFYGFYANPHSTGTNIIGNFGQDSSFSGNKTAQGNTDANAIGDFFYAPPDGFLALCTSNLAKPTIGPDSDILPTQSFNTVLYTGNGGTLAVDGFGHQPDFLWIKSRNIAGNHRLTDSTRGVSANIITNANDFEKGDSDAEDIDSFNSDGFAVTQASYDDFNDGSDTYVAWSWKANGGTATATGNESGNNPAYNVQANATAGFSIVTYTGTGAAGTVPHGLGVKPGMIWAKARAGGSSGEHWTVLHSGLRGAGGDYYDYRISLSKTDTNTDNTYWNDTEPTDSVFTVGSYDDINPNGYGMLAYCFAEVTGYSRISHYTGNGNASGTYVHLGFRPAWVLIKNTADTDNWYLADDKRNTTNPIVQILNPNRNAAEYTTGSNKINFLSNGFKCRDSASGDTNINGERYVYIAFAQSPFKYANPF